MDKPPNGRESRRVLAGDRQSTYRRGNRPHALGKELHVRRKYHKLRNKLGTIKTYDLDKFHPCDSTAGSGENTNTAGTITDTRAGPEVGGDTSVSTAKTKPSRTKQRKNMFKRTKAGQPVMSVRIDKMLAEIKQD
jgi:hypothetical protein